MLATSPPENLYEKRKVGGDTYNGYHLRQIGCALIQIILILCCGGNDKKVA
jgi:hypothetical protein